MNCLFLLCLSLGMLAMALELVFLLAFESHHPADPGGIEGGSARREVAEGPKAEGTTHPFWAKPARPLAQSAFWLAFGAGGIVGDLLYSWVGSLLAALLLGALGAWSFGRSGGPSASFWRRGRAPRRRSSFAREPSPASRSLRSASGWSRGGGSPAPRSSRRARSNRSSWPRGRG